MCMDAIMNHIMQQMVASGQIEVPTGTPRMEIMVPDGHLQFLTPVEPIAYDISKSIPDMRNPGNIVTYNPGDFSKSLESVEAFKAAYPGFKGFFHHIWNRDSHEETPALETNPEPEGYLHHSAYAQ